MCVITYLSIYLFLYPFSTLFLITSSSSPLQQTFLSTHSFLKNLYTGPSHPFFKNKQPLIIPAPCPQLFSVHIPPPHPPALATIVKLLPHHFAAAALHQAFIIAPFHHWPFPDAPAAKQISPDSLLCPIHFRQTSTLGTLQEYSIAYFYASFP